MNLLVSSTNKPLLEPTKRTVAVGSFFKKFEGDGFVFIQPYEEVYMMAKQNIT